VTGCLQPRRAIDEKGLIINRIFYVVRTEASRLTPEFRGIETYTEQPVGVGIDRGVQPISLAVGLDTVSSTVT